MKLLLVLILLYVAVTLGISYGREFQRREMQPTITAAEDARHDAEMRWLTCKTLRGE